MSGSGIRLIAAITMASVTAAGCRRPVQIDSPEVTSRPAATAPAPADAAPAARPAPDESDTTEVRVRTVADPQQGWLRIVKLYAQVEGGWATGDVDSKRNKIIIDTHNVSEFSLDQRELPVRWDRLVVLRINARSVELTRKEHPVIHFRQTKSGAWEVVKK